MTEPSTSSEVLKNVMQSVNLEIGGCDRCYQRFYAALQQRPDLFRGGKQRVGRRPERGRPADGPLRPSTAGCLLEAGRLGETVLALSRACNAAPALGGRKHALQLENAYRNIALCEAHLDTLKERLVDVLTRRVELRIDGVVSGTSAERQEAEQVVRQRYRERREEVGRRRQMQVDNLRRQLAADLDFEEKDAARRIAAAKRRRLDQVEEQLTALGCTGPEFRVRGSRVDVLHSEVVEVAADGFAGPVVLPASGAAEEALRRLERRELAHFLVYGRAPVRAGRRRKRDDEAALRVQTVPWNGSLLVAPCPETD